jgi:cell division protein FtsQ
LPYFNISEVRVENNNNISTELIKKLSGLTYDNNIFYINIKNTKTNIYSNPYILSVDIRRQLPSIVILTVKERDAMFYIKIDNQFIIIDSKGIILELRDNIDNMNLISLEGINYKNPIVGKSILSDEERKYKILVSLSEILKRNKSEIKPTRIDMSNISNINIYVMQMCIKIGSEYDIETKLNKAINVISKFDIKNKKGYVDVSFEGNPVFYLEK